MNAYIVTIWSPHREPIRLFAESAFAACVAALKKERLPEPNTAWYFIGSRSIGRMGSAHNSIQLTVEKWYDAGCQWCGARFECDCEERKTCPQAGDAGHRSCGSKPCGCPNFVTCEHKEVRDGL